MKLKHYIEYIFLRFCVLFFRTMPLKISLFFVHIITDLCFYVFKYRKRVTLENLKIAFGKEKTLSEIYDISKKVYRNFGYAFIEILTLSKYRDEEIKNMAHFNGKEILDNALTQGKGVVAVSAHLGNEEFLVHFMRAYKYPMNFIIGEQKNKLVDRMMNDFRGGNRVKLIKRDFPVKQVMKALRSGEIVALVSDQDAGKGGVFVDFFGKKASTPQGAARFALKTGSPVVLVCDLLPSKENKKHNVIVRQIKVDLTGDTEKDIFLITQEFTRIIEDIIREHPDQYFWMHRRWKTRPQ